MDTTIRNIDEEAYRRLRTYAAHEGISIGQALSELVLRHVALPEKRRPKVSFWDLKPWDWGPGTERTSEEIDKIVYGETQE